jgi:hypothetical protein
MSRSLCEACGASRGKAEYDEGSYCFSCHKKEFAHSLIPISKTNNQKMLPKYNEEDKRYELTIEQKQYLKQYYLSDEQIEMNGIYNSPEERRIIFPIDARNGWGRSLKDKTKWLYYGSDSVVYYKSGLTPGDTLVLVEDVISCIRVSKYADTIALCSTVMKENIMPYIMEYKNIVLWLDGDVAGIKGAEKIKRQLQLYRRVGIISTRQDPKCYINAKIEELLNDRT